jgi:hypothetical protein
MNHSRQEKTSGINRSYFYYFLNIKLIFDEILGGNIRFDGMLQSANDNSNINTNDIDSAAGSITIAC